jgi:hypothetical protein
MLYEQQANNPIAGTGLNITETFKTYLESNFTDVLINTYFRTTNDEPNIFGYDEADHDDQID